MCRVPCWRLGHDMHQVYHRANYHLVIPTGHPAWATMGAAEAARRRTYAQYLLNDAEIAANLADVGPAGPAVVGEADFRAHFSLRGGLPRARRGPLHNLHGAI